jgi:hypothetical protein
VKNGLLNAFFGDLEIAGPEYGRRRRAFDVDYLYVECD